MMAASDSDFDTSLAEPVPPWMQLEEDTNESDSESDDFVGDGWHTAGSSLKLQGANVRRLAMRGFENVALPAGRRIRHNFSWLSCPDNFNHPLNDIDIAVCSDSQQKCFGISQSLHDNSEGFEIVSPQDVPDLTAWAVFEEPLFPCIYGEPGLIPARHLAVFSE